MNTFHMLMALSKHQVFSCDFHLTWNYYFCALWFIGMIHFARLCLHYKSISIGTYRRGDLLRLSRACAKAHTVLMAIMIIKM